MDSTSAPTRSGLAFWASRCLAVPCKTFLGVGLACYLIVEKSKDGSLSIRFPKEGKDLTAYKTEFYPLSAFPMYSTFAEEVFFVFLTDSQDQPVALKSIPGATCSAMTKDYNHKRDDLKDAKKAKGRDAQLPLAIRQEAGLRGLENLMLNMARPWFAARPQEAFRLKEGIITQKNGKIGIQITQLAETSFAAASAPQL